MFPMKERTPNGNMLTEIILESTRLNGAMLQAENELTKPFGLTSARWQVMVALVEAEQFLTVPQIARRRGLSRQGVQRIVNDLLKLGLLMQKTNIDHKSAPLISMSEEGQKAMGQINVAKISRANQMSVGLSERALQQTLKVLRSIRERSEKP